jgi:hypothetical protein
MHPDIRKLQDELFVAERKHTSLKAQLDARRRDCRHAWSKLVYDPIITPAYDIPGDAPGTMGVDYRGPCHVPRSEKARWKRECSECGDVEFTFEAQDKVEKIPVFRR